MCYCLLYCKVVYLRGDEHFVVRCYNCDVLFERDVSLSYTDDFRKAVDDKFSDLGKCVSQ